MTYEDIIRFIFYNKGRNGFIEIIEFLKVFKKKKFLSVSPQGIGKQRMFIKPELFENIYKMFVDFIYGEHENFQNTKVTS